MELEPREQPNRFIDVILPDAKEDSEDEGSEAATDFEVAW